MTVHVTKVIEAPIEEVWKFLRGFNDLPCFHPAIKASKITHGHPEEIGCIRHLTLDSGYVFEELLLLDDDNFALDYSITETSLGLKNYVAKIRLKKHSDKHNTICEWSANFDVEDGVDKEEMQHIVREHVFKAGFIALAEKLQCLCSAE